MFNTTTPLNLAKTTAFNIYLGTLTKDALSLKQLIKQKSGYTSTICFYSKLY